MYRPVLLTNKEQHLLLKIIDHYGSHKGKISSEDDINLHIIKRHLLGLIPTKCVNEYVNEG